MIFLFDFVFFNKNSFFDFLTWCLFELFVDVCFCGYCVGGIGGGRGRGGIGVVSGERGGAVGGAGDGGERGRGRGRGQRGARGAVRGRGSGVTRGAWRGVREHVTGRLPLLTVLCACVFSQRVRGRARIARAAMRGGGSAIVRPRTLCYFYSYCVSSYSGDRRFFFFLCVTFCRTTKRCVEFIETF